MEKESKYKMLHNLPKTNEILLAMKKTGFPDLHWRYVYQFCASYWTEVSQKLDAQKIDGLLSSYCEKILDCWVSPVEFAAYHEAVRAPFDYYRFGTDLIANLIAEEESKIQGLEHLDNLMAAWERGANLIFLANHQSEADPQVISFLLEALGERYSMLAERLICVAGHKVITDPMAIPLSYGRNLFCIYSKRYVNEPPEEREIKQLHNRKTLSLMQSMLHEGRCAIYIAPSGGRDRIIPGEKDLIAPFEPQSVEMLRLMARVAKSETILAPLALKTYKVMPAPLAVCGDLGEERPMYCDAVHLAFLPPIRWLCEDLSGDKSARRVQQAQWVQQLVQDAYDALP